VFVNATDPVGSGFVASLARPGGNITGFSNFEPLIGGKWVQLLKEIAPRATRIAIISNPESDPQTRFYSSSIEVAAASLSLKVIVIPVHDSAEIGSAMVALGRDTDSGLIVLSGLFTFVHRELITGLAHAIACPPSTRTANSPNVAVCCPMVSIWPRSSGRPRLMLTVS
jgi:putative ABC transport system substrate-binding protein